MIDPERGALALLDDAATALLAAGCADPFTTTPAMRLRCLWAGERLQALGAQPARAWSTTRTDELAGVVVISLVGLTLLAGESATTDEVAEAQVALSAALAELA